MGRVRGKGKKQVVTAREDPGSGGEEKNPALRRRGRPQKPLKDDIQVGEDPEKTEEDPKEEAKGLNYHSGSENGRKRKRSSQIKEDSDSVKEETVIVETKPAPENTLKFVGFRHVGSRRKNKPHRAAEVGVECN